jgi:hypothetical protein
LLDTFELYDSNNSKIIINEKGLAHEYEYSLYKRPQNWEDHQWIDVTDGIEFIFIRGFKFLSKDHFIVWMRISPTNRFRKLWGKIETDLKPGKYNLVVNNSKKSIALYNNISLFFPLKNSL